MSANWKNTTPLEELRIKAARRSEFSRRVCWLKSKRPANPLPDIALSWPLELQRGASVSLALAGSCTDFSRCVSTPVFKSKSPAEFIYQTKPAKGAFNSKPGLEPSHFEFRRNDSLDSNALFRYTMSPIGTAVQIGWAANIQSKLPSLQDSLVGSESGFLSKLPSRWDSNCRCISRASAASGLVGVQTARIKLSMTASLRAVWTSTSTLAGKTRSAAQL